MKLFIFLTFLSHLVLAQNIAPKFSPNAWTPGLHIFAGAGVNASSYKSSQEDRDMGMGSNFKTDVGWYFNERWALESSASVKFNQVKDTLIWDTLLTLGLRYQFVDSVFDYDGNYGRFFIGTAPTVIFLSSEEKENYNGASRLHFEGPVAGIGMGRLQTTKSGLVWFYEGNFSIQNIKRRSDVKMDGEIPVVISSEAVKHNSSIYSLYLTVGILLF